jgi:RNA polymerase sigma-70 factor (ECF subfamily)
MPFGELATTAITSRPDAFLASAALAHPMTRERAGDRDVASVRDEDARGAIERLYALHSAEIHAYLFRMMREPGLAADMTQDTFVKAYRAYATLEDRTHARAWLYQIAHRIALDELRRRRIIRFLPWTGESHGSGVSAERVVMDLQLSADLERALLRIPERQRAALLLAEIHELTGLELASALGVSHVAARALLTRARESLRVALADERRQTAEREAAQDAARMAAQRGRRP